MPETGSAKTVTETVVNNASKSTVKISLDEYNSLMKKANKPTVQNFTEIIKTNEQNASDNKMWGIALCFVGVAITASGVLAYQHGKKLASQ
jgi:predicted HAD superfamily phosphohydrolase YqeG